MSYETFAGYYDALTSNIDYRAIAEYYDRLNLKFGGKRGIMLDLACGTGSLSALFSRMGYDVIGTDVSPEMLNIAVSKEHKGIEYLCQDMTELDLFGTITSAVCSLDSINHLSGADEVKRAFEKVSLFSEPGAVFLFDVNTLYKHERILADNTFVYETDDVFCVWENEYLGNGKTAITLDFFINEKDDIYRREYDEFTETAYERELTERLLAQTGFELCACYEYLTENEPSDTSEKLTFAARKI